MIGSMGRKEKLRDLLNIPDNDTEIEIHRKNSMEVVEMLQSDESQTRKKGVWMIKKLSKDDAVARAALAAAGAIPPLVAMIGGGVGDEEASLYAALNLGFRNDVNKAAIVESGAVQKMLKLIESTKGVVVTSSTKDAIVANLLSLSALDSNKPVIGAASGALKFLVQVMKNNNGLKIKEALNAVLNLSTCESNIGHIIHEAEAIQVLLLKALEIEMSGRALSILSNIASIEQGADAIGECGESYGVIIEVLRWSELHECQEKAAYILMVMAKRRFAYRRSMADCGAVSALLEVTLLGSTLAQERSSRVLELLMNASSSSSSSSSSSGGYERVVEEGESEERKVVRELVRESLEMNMRRMLERARLVLHF